MFMRLYNLFAVFLCHHRVNTAAHDLVESKTGSNFSFSKLTYARIVFALITFAGLQSAWKFNGAA